jgi:hypothetical protein
MEKRSTDEQQHVRALKSRRPKTSCWCRVFRFISAPITWEHRGCPRLGACAAIASASVKHHATLPYREIPKLLLPIGKAEALTQCAAPQQARERLARQLSIHLAVYVVLVMHSQEGVRRVGAQDLAAIPDGTLAVRTIV